MEHNNFIFESWIFSQTFCCVSLLHMSGFSFTNKFEAFPTLPRHGIDLLGYFLRGVVSLFQRKMIISKHKKKEKKSLSCVGSCTQVSF